MKVIDLSDIEKRAVLNWYEQLREDSSHFGQAQYVFAEEERLANKIKKSESDRLELHDLEIKIIFDWMEESIYSKFGAAVFLMPGEESVFEKIKYLVEKLEEEEKKKFKFKAGKLKPGKSYRLLARLKKETEAREEQERKETLARLAIEKLTLRLVEVSRKVAEIKKFTAEKKNRPVEDKISATIQLKSELEEMRAKLKLKK
jgi:hypothetical protein